MTLDQWIAQYGTVVGPVSAVGLFLLYQVVRGLVARGKSQDERDKSLSAIFEGMVKTLGTTLASIAQTNEKTATVIDNVTTRIEANTKFLTENAKDAATQRGEQLVQLKALTGAVMNPINTMGPVIEAVNGPLGKAIKDVNMDTTEILHKLETMTAALTQIQTTLNELQSVTIPKLEQQEEATRNQLNELITWAKIQQSTPPQQQPASQIVNVLPAGSTITQSDPPKEITQ